MPLNWVSWGWSIVVSLRPIWDPRIIHGFNKWNKGKEKGWKKTEEESWVLTVSQKVAYSTEWQGDAKSRKTIQNIIKTYRCIPLRVTLKGQH